MSIALETVNIGLGSLIKVTEYVKPAPSEVNFSTTWATYYETPDYVKEANTDLMMYSNMTSYNATYTWGGCFYSIEFSTDQGSTWNTFGNSGYCGGMHLTTRACTGHQNRILIKGQPAGNIRFRWRVRSYSGTAQFGFSQTGWLADPKNYPKIIIEEWTRSDSYDESDPLSYSSITRKRATKQKGIIRNIKYTNIESPSSGSSTVTGVASDNFTKAANTSVYVKINSSFYYTTWVNNNYLRIIPRLEYSTDGGTVWNTTQGFELSQFGLEMVAVYNASYAWLLPNIAETQIMFRLHCDQFPNVTTWVNYGAAASNHLRANVLFMELDQ